jgi:hypothetical protein
MGLVGPLLPGEIDVRVAGIIGRLGWRRVLRLEALVTSPRFDERSINREVLVGEKLLRPRLLDTRSKNRRSMSPDNSRSRFFVKTVGAQTESV